MKHISTSWVIYFLPLCFFSCKCGKKENVIGGPCTYETRHYPATVISIEVKDSSHIDLLFRIENVKGQLYRDSVSWFMENKNWLTFSELEKDSVILGNKFEYHIEEIKTGSCTPRIEKLTLNKYAKLHSYEEMKEKIRTVTGL